ncbi:MAG: CHAD domain-containing protein [Formivibrio sp.]|nr:CHAD domain-containing protein [Formivibrio sp.]
MAIHLGEIAAARRRTLEGCDPESLHDLRVAMRALRVVLPLLGKQLEPLRQEWAMLARITGPSRDLEVLLALIDTLPRIPATIRDRLSQQENEARLILLKQLASPQLPQLIQCTRIELNAAIHDLTLSQLRKRTEKRALHLHSVITQQISVLVTDSPPQAWHSLRLEVKRLRYLIEHCGDWLPSPWMSIHPPLKRCQTALGELHDIDLLISLIGYPLSEARQSRQEVAQAAVTALTCALN